MPYAQAHYPFENKERFEAAFPADFIAEGLDQTRGWFYTLMVLSTALFDRPAFKSLVCNGMVLAADGKKMSKRLKNYPDPNEVRRPPRTVRAAPRPRRPPTGATPRAGGGQVRRRCAAPLPRQLARRARRVAALRGARRVRGGQGGVPAVVQRVPLPRAKRGAHARRGRRLRPNRHARGGAAAQRARPVAAGGDADAGGGRAARDGRIPPLQRRAQPRALHRGAHQHLRPLQPRPPQGQGRRRRRRRRARHALRLPRQGAPRTSRLPRRRPPLASSHGHRALCRSASRWRR